MKTFEITLKSDSGNVNIRTRADSLAAAKRTILAAENAPESAVVTWRVIPTAKQIRRTQSLLRGI